MGPGLHSVFKEKPVDAVPESLVFESQVKDVAVGAGLPGNGHEPGVSGLLQGL